MVCLQLCDTDSKATDVVVEKHKNSVQTESNGTSVTGVSSSPSVINNGSKCVYSAPLTQIGSTNNFQNGIKYWKVKY